MAANQYTKLDETILLIIYIETFSKNIILQGKKKGFTHNEEPSLPQRSLGCDIHIFHFEQP